MPEEFLDGAQIGAFAEKMSREGVPQRVRMQSGIAAEEYRVFLDDSCDRASGERSAATVHEQRVGRGIVLSQDIAAGRQVGIERLKRLVTERRYAFLLALALYE